MSKRARLPVVSDACPPRRDRCHRAGCRWHLASELTDTGAIVVGNVGAGRGVVVPPRIARRGQTPSRLIEWAARFVAANVRRKRPACMWLLVAAHPGGMQLHEIGEALGVTRQAVEQIETRALAKVGGALLSLGAL